MMAAGDWTPLGITRYRCRWRLRWAWPWLVPIGLGLWTLIVAGVMRWLA